VNKEINMISIYDRARVSPLTEMKSITRDASLSTIQVSKV